MGEKGVWVFQRWLRDQIAADVPLDEFARRSSPRTGSTWQNPPASFYRTNRDPMTAAETVGQVFLGVRLQCARCHNHPFDVWTQDDYYGLAAYFGNVRRKEVNNVRARRPRQARDQRRRDHLPRPAAPRSSSPAPAQMLAPKPPGGPQPDLDDDPDALDDLADWLTRDNPQFARNMANRVWFHLMGRGVVEPVDDFRDSNPPVEPRPARRPDRRARRRRVSAPPAGRPDHEVADLRSSAPEPERDERRRRGQLLPRRRPAPAGRGPARRDRPGPGHARAVRRTPRRPSAPSSCPAPGWAATFLKIFGKPDRLLTCECERSESTTLAQAFQLINGESIRAQARGRRQPDRPPARARAPPTPRSSTSSPSPPSAASPTPPSAPRSSATSPRRRTAARPGRMWPGRSSTARNSCSGIDPDRSRVADVRGAEDPAMNHGCPDFRATLPTLAAEPPQGRRGRVRRPEPADAPPGRRGAAASGGPAEGQARHLPPPVRRAVAPRHVRHEARRPRRHPRRVQADRSRASRACT